jgi:GDP-4-dehydro-6-deoxy-D-mannose reductase
VRGPILVTGANGFAGSHLVDLLRASGELVVGWQRPRPSLSTRSTVELRNVDVLDAAAVEREMSALRPAAVFHCAGAAHVGDSWQASRVTLETNVRGTHHLLEADRRLALGARILIPGSATVYQASTEPLHEDSPLGPDSPYGVSKLAQEQLGVRAAAEGQHVVVTRSFNHVGVRQSPSFAAASFARQVALIEAGAVDPVIRVGNLTTRRDVTDVRDTVRAYALLVEHGTSGVVYNVCSGHAVSTGEILERLCARARIHVDVQSSPSLYRPHDAPVIIGDNALLVRATGWHPAIPLDQTLDELLEFWRLRMRETRQTGVNQ